MTSLGISDSTHFINLTSPLPASRQRSRATKNSSRAVLYQTFKWTLLYQTFKCTVCTKPFWFIWKLVLDLHLFLSCLHAGGHLQLSALLGHHVHLHQTEWSEKQGRTIFAGLCEPEQVGLMARNHRGGNSMASWGQVSLFKFASV